MYTVVYSERYFSNTAGSVQFKVCALVSGKLQGIKLA
jgi:hypothetical protein